MPPVLDLDPRAFGTNPEVTVYFTSVDHVRDVLERDPTLSQWRSSAQGAVAQQVVMLSSRKPISGGRNLIECKRTQNKARSSFQSL